MTQKQIEIEICKSCPYPTTAKCKANGCDYMKRKRNAIINKAIKNKAVRV